MLVLMDEYGLDVGLPVQTLHPLLLGNYRCPRGNARDASRNTQSCGTQTLLELASPHITLYSTTPDLAF